jgi:2-polyprenyl-6-methoxyphenol hydroxylase-like FAD-dependent oxidoreductase
VNASPRPVVIVGAGPAGAALALLLVSRGIAATLVERQRDFEREFRGEAMMPSGLAVLDALGVDLARDGIPHSRPSELEIYVEGRRVLRLDPTAPLFAGRSPLMVSQPALLEHLVELASRWPGFRFLRGAAARELVREDARVRGVRIHTEAGGDETLHAQLVIGADGRGSFVRRRAGFAVREIGAPLDVVWAKVAWPAGWEGAEVRGYVGGGHLLIALPAPDGLLQLAWIIRKGSYGDLRARGVQEWVREMAEHVSPDLAGHLRAHAEQLTHPFLLSAVTDRVLGWSQPGALVVGDAAHTMSPVGGQGVNLALRDALVAANHLVPAFAGSETEVDVAAARIEAERAPEIDRIQALAAVPPRVVMGTRAAHEWIRRALPLLLRLAPVRALARRQLGLFLDGVTEVSLRV